MKEENCIVVDLQQGFARVEAERKTACGACNAADSCSSGVLSRLFAARKVSLTVKNTIGARIGDKVTIEVSDKGFLYGTFLVYLFPLLTMLATAILGKLLLSVVWQEAGEWAVAVFGFLGLAASFLWMNKLRVLVGDRMLKPEIRAGSVGASPGAG
jgi:sigma-E factor negative regulatory protein RseC